MIISLEWRRGFRIETVPLLSTIPQKELEVLSMSGFSGPVECCGVFSRTLTVWLWKLKHGDNSCQFGDFFCCCQFLCHLMGGLIWELTDDLEHKKKASCWSEVSKYDFHFSRTDGSFVVHDIPSGSYVVEVISPAYRFDPVRVDITSKGKMR